MLQAYSTNVTVSANTAIPFNSSALDKGCAESHPSADTIVLNKCGVYKISVDASAEASGTIQLYKDGVALPQAQNTGATLGFSTFVQTTQNNSCCPCASGANIQVKNVGTSDLTLVNANITVEKIA